VQKTQEAPLARVGESFRASPREVLLQVADGAAPLRVIFAQSVDLPAQEGALGKLLEAAYQMDPVEPLERVASALQTLVKPV
jgi:hypothetical protein